MTREEILGIPSYPHECGGMIEIHTRQGALKAMSEFAQQEAIAFAEWMRKNKWQPFGENMWASWDVNVTDDVYTSTQLYSLFKTTKNG